MHPFVGILLLLLLLVSGKPFTSTAATYDMVATPVKVPILLYHHIGHSRTSDRYYVSEEAFRKQMKYLHKMGYRTISVARLAHVLAHGGYLPQRPVIITFDDGNLSVYEKAFPIMQEYGFSGVVYIVSNRLKADDFMHPDELQELIEHGWEVGSHSMTHTNLVQNHALVRQEILQSRLDLEHAVDSEVDSFAYPFGLADPYVQKKVLDYGYEAGVGVGTAVTHTLGTSYYLSRREVYGNSSMQQFMDLLPWTSPLPPQLYPRYRTE